MAFDGRAADHDADAEQGDEAGDERGPVPVMPSHSQPRPAVRNGAAAKITATSATDVRRSALM